MVFGSWLRMREGDSTEGGAEGLHGFHGEEPTVGGIKGEEEADALACMEMEEHGHECGGGAQWMHSTRVAIVAVAVSYTHLTLPTKRIV